MANLTEQAQLTELVVSEEVLNFASGEFWLITGAIWLGAGLLSGLFTQGLKKNVLVPWAGHKGHKEKWWWKPMLWAVAIVMGTVVGLGLGGTIWQTGMGVGIGALVGCIGGLSTTTIVAAYKRKVKKKLDEL